jgi:hypothetical protein
VQLSLGELEAACIDDFDQVFDLGLDRALLKALLEALLLASLEQAVNEGARSPPGLPGAPGWP